MPMTGFFCQDVYLAKTAKLTDEEVGRLFRALINYHANGVVADLNGRESIAFDFIKEDIDKDEAAYAKKCKQASENRRKALSNNATDVDGGQQTLTDVDGGDKYNKNKKNIIKDNNSSSKNIVPLKRFVPPTEDEVELYCVERRNHVNAQKFVDYYSSNGWKVGRNPMKDWKAAVRTWERSEFTEKDYQREMESSDLPW